MLMLGHSIDSNQYFYFLEGIDFLFTTAHELGHSFGLAHSDHRDSIMAPIYRSSISEHYQMAYDDIIAIQVSAQPSTRHDIVANDFMIFISNRRCGLVLH